jgi:hypothetical protein
LLRDVAEALKHHVWNPDKRKNATVAAAGDVTAVAPEWGQLRWGEFTWGGSEQIVVTRMSGERRALQSILQNVFDAWMRLLGQPLPALGTF